MKKIYKTKPLNYRQWGQIKKEAYQLLFCIVGLMIVATVIETAARLIF